MNVANMTGGTAQAASTNCDGGNCTDNSVSNGLPYLILIITLVLCSILLATIALIIIVVLTRHRRKRLDSATDETAISYDDLAKPGMTAMEVQPDMRALEPRNNDPRSFMPFAPLPSRRFIGPAPYDAGQRRLIPVPEEEGSGSDEGRISSSHDNLAFTGYANYGANGNLGDAEDNEGDDDVDQLVPHSAADARRMMAAAALAAQHHHHQYHHHHHAGAGGGAGGAGVGGRPMKSHSSDSAYETEGSR